MERRAAKMYVAPIRLGAKTAKVSRINIKTGKMEAWKTVAAPRLSSDGNAYAYL
jgi:hypothetical protein